MKTCNTLFILGLIFCLSLIGHAGSLNAQDSSRSAKTAPTEKPRKKFIGFYYLKSFSFLEFHHPGIHFNSPMVPGTYKLEADGFRFSPATKSADGFPQDRFDNFFWYNHIVKDLYIPYSDIKSVSSKRSLVIKTKEGRKFRIITRDSKKTRDDLRLKISH